jgi:hypothetical protein
VSGGTRDESDGFISTSVTISLNYSRYSDIAYLHILQFNVAQVLRFSVFTNSLVATKLTTSNPYEVLLPFPVPTITEKRVERIFVPTPGPAIYYIERCPIMRGERPPAYTFGVRRHEPMAKREPGPNTYQIPPCFGCKIPNKASAPIHTIRGRPLERAHFRTPGPNKYTLPEMDIYKSGHQDTR